MIWEEIRVERAASRNSAWSPPDGAVIWLCGPAAPETRAASRSVTGTSSCAPLPYSIWRKFKAKSQRRFASITSSPRKVRRIKRSYLQLLVLITLFILFFATWLALFLAKQISVPITALLGAAQEIRRGNLGTKVEVGAVDELASLVRAFNEMSLDLEANSRELENRRRFTEAILEAFLQELSHLPPTAGYSGSTVR